VALAVRLTGGSGHGDSGGSGGGHGGGSGHAGP
jgi:hypothetical protein